MRASIVIPVKGEEALTKECLTSLREWENSSVEEVLIVDNSVDDSTATMLNDFIWGRVRRVTGDPSLNFSQACNLGAKEAKSDYILFMNNDLVLTQETIEPTFEAHYGLGGIVGATLYYPDGTIQHGGERLPFWGIPHIGGQGASSEDPRYLGVKAKWGVIAAYMLIEKSLFENLGGFDEEYIFGLEDVDLCMSAVRRGENVTSVGGLGIIHYESKTIDIQRPYFKVKDMAMNISRFRRRWATEIDRLTTRFVDSLQGSGVDSVALFGNGQAARGGRVELERRGMKVTQFIVSDEYKTSDKCDGLPVVSPENAGSSGDKILIATQKHVEAEVILANLTYMIEDAELFDERTIPNVARSF